MRILISENQLDKLVIRYLIVNHLDHLKPDKDIDMNIFPADFYLEKSIVMHWEPKFRVMNVKIEYLHSLIEDIHNVFGKSSYFSGSIKKAIEEKYNIYIRGLDPLD